MVRAAIIAVLRCLQCACPRPMPAHAFRHHHHPRRGRQHRGLPALGGVCRRVHRLDYGQHATTRVERARAAGARVIEAPTGRASARRRIARSTRATGRLGARRSMPTSASATSSRRMRRSAQPSYSSNASRGGRRGRRLRAVAAVAVLRPAGCATATGIPTACCGCFRRGRGRFSDDACTSACIVRGRVDAPARRLCCIDSMPSARRSALDKMNRYSSGPRARLAARRARRRPRARARRMALWAFVRAYRAQARLPRRTARLRARRVMSPKATYYRYLKMWLACRPAGELPAQLNQSLLQLSHATIDASTTNVLSPPLAAASPARRWRSSGSRSPASARPSCRSRSRAFATRTAPPQPLVGDHARRPRAQRPVPRRRRARRARRDARSRLMAEWRAPRRRRARRRLGDAPGRRPLRRSLQAVGRGQGRRPRRPEQRRRRGRPAPGRAPHRRLHLREADRREGRVLDAHRLRDAAPATATRCASPMPTARAARWR